MATEDVKPEEVRVDIPPTVTPKKEKEVKAASPKTVTVRNMTAQSVQVNLNDGSELGLLPREKKEVDPAAISNSFVKALKAKGFIQVYETK